MPLVGFISLEKIQIKTTVDNCVNFDNAVTDVPVVSVVLGVYIPFGE